MAFASSSKILQAIIVSILAVSVGADTGSLLQQAISDLQQGRLEAAEHKLMVFLEEKPGSATAYFYLGTVRFRAHRFAEARQALEQAIRLAPGAANAWKALGAVHAAEGNFRLAEAPFRKACELDPKEEDACYYWARNYYALNQFERAIAAFRRALAVDPQPWRVHNGLGLALEALGRGEEAERHFRQAVERYRGQGRADDNPRIDLGVFLYMQGRTDEAQAQLEAAVETSPSSTRARFELGKVLLKENRLEAAGRELEKATELDPKNWAGHLLLGKVYYRLGRAEDAERHTQLGEKGLQARPAR